MVNKGSNKSYKRRSWFKTIYHIFLSFLFLLFLFLVSGSPVSISQDKSAQSPPLTLPSTQKKQAPILEVAKPKVEPLTLPPVAKKPVPVISQPKVEALALSKVETARGILNLRDFSGGLNLKGFPTEIKDNEAQVLNNAYWKKGGALGRRSGWTHITIPDTAIGITGLYRYYKQDSTRYLMVAGDTALYRQTNDAGSFVKIKGGVPVGDYFNFVTYKDNLVATHKNMISIGYDGSEVKTLGILDTLYAKTISISACTTIYEMQGKVWDVDEWIGYLLHNTSYQDNSYELIVKNTSNQLYTINSQDVIQNGYMELLPPSLPDSTPMFWTQYINFKQFDTYSSRIVGGTGGYGRQLLRNVQDSTTYNITWTVNVSNNTDSQRVVIRKGSDVNSIIRWIAKAPLGFPPYAATYTDTFYTGAEESVYVEVRGGTGHLNYDDISVKRKYYSRPKDRFYLLNWFGGAEIESGTLDTVKTEPSTNGCKQYLWGVSNTRWTNHLIEITSGDLRGEKKQIKNINASSYVEPPFNYYDLFAAGKPTYKISTLSFWQSYYCAVFQNRLILARDSLSNNIIYYSEANSWQFLPLNLFTTNTADGDGITGLRTLYNDQMGQRASPNDRLLIFKSNNILGCGSDFLPYVIVTGVGAIAPNSIINAEGQFIGFASNDGYYATDGNKVSKLSEKIQSFWDNINKSKKNLIACGYDGQRHIFCSVPYGSATENDTGLIYNIDNQSWSTASLKASVFANQWGLADTVKFIWGRPDTGWVCKYGLSNYDNADTTNGIIELRYKSKEFDFGDMSSVKRFQECYVSYDKTLPLTFNFYKDFGTSTIYSTSLTGTGKNIVRIPLSGDIWGKTLSYGVSSKDPSITLGGVQIKFSIFGGY